MGARTDFVRAMLFGVVIGVALTTAFFQLRGGSSASQPADKPVPDRAAERDALLAKAKPALDRCAQGTAVAITLALGLSLDDGGRIVKVDSNAKQLGQEAATCAETALLQAASFAPAPMATYVPLTVVLGK